MPPIKTITVYRNGDAFFTGRKVVVSGRRAANFDGLLTCLTATVEAPFGAVRNLYTAKQGHRVPDLDHLQHGSPYVAAGSERYKKLEYCEITRKKPENRMKEQILPIIHSRVVAPARWNSVVDESYTIKVLTNGEVLVPPVHIRIPKYTLRSWENVLAMVTERVRLRTGAVYRLCTLDGHAVRGPTELENNQYYVAVGADKFRALPYDKYVPSRALISHNILPAVRKPRQAKDVFAHAGFAEDLEHTARGHVKKHTSKTQRTKQQRQVSRIPALFPAGEGGVFNAKATRREAEGAAEVQEDEQLKVELPIDQVEAKIVTEEYEHMFCCKASLHDLNGSCLQEDKEAEVSSQLCRKPSRMSQLFKGRFIKA
ncbi:doublecortin domain-containing protein 2 [Genypterus blacodes]|uniref:doublecortin domain-containing protein 2 n=1 Tax=Genypterus blacodes TaxID=154954 RepID=UPI003F76BB06